jgi:hypothetical protein
MGDLSLPCCLRCKMPVCLCREIDASPGRGIDWTTEKGRANLARFCERATPEPWAAIYVGEDSVGRDAAGFDAFDLNTPDHTVGAFVFRFGDRIGPPIETVVVDPTGTDEDGEPFEMTVAPDNGRMIAGRHEVNRGYDTFSGESVDPEWVWLRPYDAAFIAAARAAVPQLLARLEALELELTGERKADAAPPTLFCLGDFSLASGSPSAWKIQCEALSPGDWAALARIAVERLRPFGRVEGVPRGGLPFAAALAEHTTAGCQTLLIAEDVVTSGGSIERFRAGRVAIGVCAFARGTPPPWVTPLFALLNAGMGSVCERADALKHELRAAQARVAELEAAARNA